MTIRRGLSYLNFSFQNPIEDKDLTAPPGTPVAGKRYIVGAGATGAWATHDGKIAIYTGSSWLFATPTKGWEAYALDENAMYRHNGTAWVIEQTSASQAEVDAIEAAMGAMVDANGDYVAFSGKNYINGNSDVAEDIVDLDAQIKTNADAIALGSDDQDASEVTFTPSVLTDWDGDADPGNTDAALDQLAERVDDNEIAITSTVTATGTNSTNITNVQNEVDAIETAMGAVISATGIYVAHSGTNYIDSNTTVTADLLDLDSALGTHVNTATIHRSINDSGSAVTDLWSASKITSELGGKIADVAGTAGNIAVLDGSGELSDSTILAADVILKDGSIDFTAVQSYDSAKTFTSAQDLVSKAYVDSQIAGTGTSAEWQASVKGVLNLVTSEPASPATGDRYINSATGDSSETTQAVVIDRIYEWNGTSWDETTPTVGTFTSDDSDTTSILYYGGSSWVAKYFEATTASLGVKKNGFNIEADLVSGGGIALNSNSMFIDVSDIIGNGLEDAGSETIQVKTDSTGGTNLATVINVSGNGVAVKIDDSTIGENGSSQLYVKAGGITETEIASSAFGDGITGGSGTTISADVDGTSIVLSAGKIALDSTLKTNYDTAYSSRALWDTALNVIYHDIA